MYPQHWPAAPASLLALLALLAATGAIGCASPADPVPRQRPIIPAKVQDLEARQQGNEVILTFTLPNRSARNEPLPMPPAVEIYRSESDPANPKQKVSPRLIYTIPGEMVNSYQQGGRFVYKDVIEAGELAKSGTVTRTYEIRTREARNRASAESNRVQVLTRMPPAAIEGLQTMVANRAVVLKWLPGQPAAEYRVYRAEIAATSATAASGDASKAEFVSPVRLLARNTTPNYTDQTVELGHTYMYTVRQAVNASGAEIESADSTPAVITPMQVAPPAAPQGVEALPVPAGNESPGYISLSWEISVEPGIAGYAVYRTEQAELRGTRLNEQLLPTPTYRDASIAPGKRYFYRVTAFDNANNESEASAPVEAELTAQP